jgi:prepilin-type N-terminal cleavage/methylation domain-containing protein/prepilin-type processing-associated H-X9-DG protein
MRANPLNINSGRRCEPKAFTLVELLVVISVMALLMGTLVPVVGKARSAALRIVCKSNLHNLALAFRMYLDENRDIMPPAAQLPSLEDPNDAASRPPITQFILPYVSEPRVFRCPADKVKKYYLSEGTSYEYNQRLGGKVVSKTFLAERYGERNAHVMYDYEPFHGQPGQPGAKNYLYADGHIGDVRRQ